MRRKRFLSMRPALVATLIFLAGIAPGVINHGRPVPHSDARHAPPPPAAVVESAVVDSQERGSLFFGLWGRRG
jgi:hypothetical protein